MCAIAYTLQNIYFTYRVISYTYYSMTYSSDFVIIIQDKVTIYTHGIGFVSMK